MSPASRAVKRLRDWYGSVLVHRRARSVRSSGGAHRAASSARFQPVEALEPRLLLDGTSYLVNSLADVVATDGVVTLREAIEAANTNAAVHDAPAGSADEIDLITFDQAALTQLGEQLLEVRKRNTLALGNVGQCHRADSLV